VADEKLGDGVKVVDRRWLTPEGELRDESQMPMPIAEPPAAESPEPAATPSPAAEPEAPPAIRLPQGVVLNLVDFLANHAIAFLTGEVPELGRDPNAARLFIDLLAEVQKRTQGQLSAQEAKVLDDVLFQLRAQYISPR
jgi:hypothetical protein